MGSFAAGTATGPGKAFSFLKHEPAGQTSTGMDRQFFTLLPQGFFDPSQVVVYVFFRYTQRLGKPSGAKLL